MIIFKNKKRMSKLIFEAKNSNHKNKFEIYNSPKVKNPIKLFLDTPSKFNLFQYSLNESKKYPKLFQKERSKKYLDNHLDLNSKHPEKAKEEIRNMRYNLNNKITNNLILSRNILNNLNYEENEIFSPRGMNTSPRNKIINKDYNIGELSNKLSNSRKYLEENPLISHSIDIIKNNPYNKSHRFLKLVSPKKKSINKVINENNDNTEDNFFLKKYNNISPINFKLSSKLDIKLKNNYSNKKFSLDIKRKDFINSVEKKNNYFINDIKTKKRNVIADSYKEINKKRNKLFLHIDLENNKEKEEEISDLFSNSKLFNKFFEENKSKKIIKPNYNKINYNKNEGLYSNNTINYYDKDNIERISDDESKEYYVQNSNIILEYAYKEDRNCSHKINMEDKGKSILNFNNDYNKALFCLFDGHGGDKVSTYLQKNFGEKMKNFVNISGNEEIDFEKLFQEIDEEFKNLKYYKTGSTATIIYITKNINNKIILYCINVGDTKSILIQTNGSRKLSYDDLVDDQNEHNRIINGGGYIKNGRVCGELMISRAFGDWESKQYGVICSPHITKLEINDKFKYIILASDGVWDVLDDLDVYKLSLTAENSKKLCDDIIQNSLDRESTDNVSCFVIKLND